MTYPSTPTTFEDVINVIPARGSIVACRFIIAGRPFELEIGRTSMNVVWLEFAVPDGKNQFWPNMRTVESLTSKRDIWALWEKFLADPDDYLTWNYIGRT